MLERELRELSFVPRWSTLRRVRTESVAEHSYYVAVYASQVSDMIGWRGDRARLLRAALYHDLPEIASGDPPGPAKRASYDRMRLHYFQMRYVQTRFPDQLIDWGLGEVDSDICAIVKVADILDEVMYLQTERGMGNLNIGDTTNPDTPLGNSLGRLHGKWFELPGKTYEELHNIWGDEVWPAILHAGPKDTSSIVLDNNSDGLTAPENTHTDYSLADIRAAIPSSIRSTKPVVG